MLGNLLAIKGLPILKQPSVRNEVLSELKAFKLT